MKKRSVRMGGVVALVMVTACVWSRVRFVFPAPHQVLVYDSPDGRWRLVIYEQVPSPRPLMQSPYVNYFAIVDRFTGVELPGTRGIQDNDSCSSPVDSFGITWRGSAVEVRSTHPGPAVHDGSVVAGRQLWVRR